MRGDILIINENHKKAAAQSLPIIIPEIKKCKGKYFITVAGESGAGKSEIAASIAEQLKEKGISSFIFQQDDYFFLPPKSNANKRKDDISWVGTQEVKIDLLNEEIADIRQGNYVIKKPLVIFEEDRIESETVDVSGYDVMIFEGTYTTMLNNIDCKIFIDRDYHDTKASRLKRNREKQDDFLERILKIEHDIISKHKSMADIIVTKDYDAQKAS